MPSCPRCHQPVDTQAIECPTCQMTLKAFGHPGIPIYRAEPGEYLCSTCIYDQDDSCTFPQRPQATECTLYVTEAQAARFQATPPAYRPTRWSQRQIGWAAIALLVLVSIVLALT